MAERPAAMAGIPGHAAAPLCPAGTDSWRGRQGKNIPGCQSRHLKGCADRRQKLAAGGGWPVAHPEDNEDPPVLNRLKDVLLNVVPAKSCLPNDLMTAHTVEPNRSS